MVIGADDKPIAACTLDLSLLQAEAELEAAGTGDPIRLLAGLVIAQLGEAGAHVTGSGRSELDAALSAAVVKGEWPPTLTVRAGNGTARDKSPVNGIDRMRTRGGQEGGSGKSHDGRPASGVPGGKSLPAAPADVFEQQIRFPSDRAREVYDSLVGLDEVKMRLGKEALLLTEPRWLDKWARKYHKGGTPRALDVVRQGAPFLVFAGDVGTGKTALAESFGDAIARELNRPVTLLRMSIQARGNGIVGDMTQRITHAFRAAEALARTSGEVTILLLDEADALAESRETQQMHHEDRAGVNALIQGVDRLRGSGTPILVVFCTNRLGNIDPAIRRRAMDIFEFRRPDDGQRRTLLDRLVGDLGLTASEVKRLVELTGPRNGRAYGFTYSDISDRLVRNAVLAAVPTRPLTFQVLEQVASAMIPTRPFENEG
ncbi:MAG: ATP-binding protein [bacterium]